MITQSKGRIFLSEDRKIKQTTGLRSCHVISPCDPSLGCLTGFTDETLGGRQSLQVTITQDCTRLVLPVVGSMQFIIDTENAVLVHPGEIMVLHLMAGAILTYENPYDTELINFLNISSYSESPVDRNILQIMRFDLNAHHSLLTHIGDMESKYPDQVRKFPGFAIGKFGGRSEAVYELTDQQKGVFVFAVEGIFEVQGRLLHSRDGLFLSYSNGSLDMEALSNNAIILLMEVSQS